MAINIPTRRMVVNTSQQLQVFVYNNTTLAPAAWGPNTFVRMVGFAEFKQADLISNTQVPYTAPVAHVVDINFPTAPVVGDEITVSIVSRNIQGFGAYVSTLEANRDMVHHLVQSPMTATQLRDTIFQLYQNKSDIGRFFTLSTIGATTIRVTAQLGIEVEPKVIGYNATVTTVTPFNVGTGHYDVIHPFVTECKAMPYTPLAEKYNVPIKGRQYRTYRWLVRGLDESPVGLSIASQISERQLEYVLYVDTTLTTLITQLNAIV